MTIVCVHDVALHTQQLQELMNSKTERENRHVISWSSPAVSILHRISYGHQCRHPQTLTIHTITICLHCILLGAGMKHAEGKWTSLVNIPFKRDCQNMLRLFPHNTPGVNVMFCISWTYNVMLLCLRGYQLDVWHAVWPTACIATKQISGRTSKPIGLTVANQARSPELVSWGVQQNSCSRQPSVCDLQIQQLHYFGLHCICA